MTRELPAITSLRGIAALGILIHHITIYLFPEIGKYTGQFTPFFQQNYLWVDFFFILSGFIAGHVYQNRFSRKITGAQFISFIVSRFTRLYPLHFVILAGFVIMELTYLYFYSHIPLHAPFTNLPIPFDSEYSLKALLLNVLFLQALPQWGTWNGPSWAISAIWLIAFTIPFSIQFIRQSTKVTDILLFSLCLFALVIIYGQQGTLDIISLSGLVRCFSETLMGIIAYKVFSHAYTKRFLDYRAGCPIIFLCALLSMALPIHPVITVLSFLLLILTAAFVKSDIIFTNPTLLLLGKISFSLYMIHWFLFQLLDKVSLVNTGVAFHRHCSLLQLTGLALLTFFLVPPVSYFAYKFIEIPLHNRLNTFTRSLLSRP